MMTRDKVIEILEKHLKCMQSYNKHCLWDIAHSCVACENFTTDEEWMQAEAYAVESLQERKTGKWIPTTVSSGRDSWTCSVCGRRARGKTKNLPYCHCGAKMEVDE